MISLLGGRIRATITELSQCQSADRFIELRKSVFPRYANLSVALANIVSAESPSVTLTAELLDDSFCAFESSICASRLEEPFKSEALFGLSTLRRTYRLMTKVFAIPVPDQSRPSDQENAAEYNYWILWSQLHLDCLMLNPEIHPLVLPEVLGGLRCSVMAYSCASQAAALRESEQTCNFSGVQWDQEDALLAKQSTDERETTILGW